MLTKETIQKLKAYGIDVDKLQEAVKSEEEVAVELPEVTVFTADELTQRDQVKTQLGRDLQMKDLKKEAGFDYTGEGSLDGKRFITELTKKAESEAIKEPDAKLKSLQEQVAILQKKNEEATAAIENERKAAKEAQFHAELLAELPSNRVKTLADPEYLTLLKANLEFTEEGVKKGGELLRNDKTAAPISRKEAIEAFFAERKWIDDAGGPTPGRGGGNSQPPAAGKPTNMREAMAQWEKDNPGKSTGTAEFGAFIIDLKKSDPNFNTSLQAS